MDQMPAVLTYPDHHAVWLDAMGVSRWVSTTSLHGIEGQVAVVDAKQATEVALAAEQSDAIVHPLPAIVQSARYWVVGGTPLSDDERRLLAGMMAAIQAPVDEVVYSASQNGLEKEAMTIQATGLATWSRLNVCAASPQLEMRLPDALKVLLLGDVVFSNAHARTWRIPSLTAMLSEPLLKREAWIHLKAMWADA